MHVDCIHVVMAVSFLFVMVLIGQIILRPPATTRPIMPETDGLQDNVHLVPPAQIAPAQPVSAHPKHRNFTSGYV